MAGNKSATLTIVIAGDAKGLSKSLKGTETQVASLGAQFKKMAGAVGIGLGTAAVIKFGKDSVSSYANAGREVLKLKRLTGETAEEASLLRFAAQQSGVSVEQMAKAWVLFSKAISAGKVEAAGIAIRDTNGELLSSDKILGNTADKFASMADGVEKNTLAVNLFGRSGAALLPFLNKGSAGVADLKQKMDQLGVSFDEAGLQKVKNYTAAQRDMSAAVEGLKLKIGSGLIPTITSLTETVSNDLPKVTAAVGGIGEVLGKIGDATGLGSAVGAIAPPLLIAGAAVTALGGAILILGPALTAGAAALSGLGAAALTTATNLLVPTAAVEGLAAAETTATATTEAFSLSLGSVTAVLVAGIASYNLTYKALEKISGQAPAVQELVDALKGIGPAGAGTSEVLDKLGTSADELANGNVYKASLAWAELDASLAQLAKTSPKEAQQAMVGLSVAMSAQGMTVDDLNGRLPRLTAALDAEGASSTSAADKADKHAKALKKQADAAKDLTAYTDGLTAAQDRVKTESDNVNAAVVKVAEAQDHAAQAAKDVTDAEEAAVQADRAVVSAKRAVADAIEGVQQARRAEEANIRSLADAEKAEAQSAKDVAAAQADLAQKRREATGDSDAMRSALERVTDAEKNLRKADEDSEAAQRRLTDARNNYQNVLASLADQKLSAEVGVRDAQRALREAEAALRDLDKDGKPVTADDRGAATDAVIKAQIALRRAQQEAADAAAELNKEQQAGRDGSTAVVAAQDDVTAAAQHQADAHRDLEVAVQNVANTQVAADKAVADAEQALADKIDARQAAHQRVIDAVQAVSDGNAAIQKAAEGVRDAEQGVADAQDGATKAHQELVDKKNTVTSALAEIANANYLVAFAITAVQAAQEKLDRYLQTHSVGGFGETGGSDPAPWAPRNSGGGKGTPADANAPTKGTKDSGLSADGGKSSGDGRASSSAKAAAGGSMGDPSIYNRPGSGTGYDWTDPTPAPAGPPAQGIDGDYYAYALSHPAKGVKQLRRPPREIHNTFHLYGVTDMQTQATLIAREQSLQLALAGGH